MDRLALMESFVAVVESGSFAGAARKLGVSPPVITRAINTLEENLNVQLIQRTTRSLRVTELGHQYFDNARSVIEAANKADEEVSGALAEPQGQLVITAPVLFGRIYITPVIVEFLQRFPHVDINAKFVDRVVDMVDEGIDLAIRIGKLADSSYRARQIGECRLVVCGSKEYFATHDIPSTPRSLEQHHLIATTAGNNSHAWRFNNFSNRRSNGNKPRLTVSTNDAAIAAARAGFGLTRVLSYQVAEQLKSGELITVLDEYEPAPRPIHIVHHDNRAGTAAMREFIKTLTDNFPHSAQG